MKYHALLITIIGFLNINQAKAIRNYNEGDTLYVLAQSGLVLRNAPDFKSEKISLLAFGTAVISKWGKNKSDPEVAVEAIPPCTYKGQNYEGYKIPGKWVQVSVNGKTGYVFDGYLSKCPSANSHDRNIDEYLTRVFGIASHLRDMGKSIYTANLDCNFYKNGASRQTRGVGDGLTETTYILPEISLEEGYLIANHFFKLEKYTNKIPLSQEEHDFFLKFSSPNLLEFRADKTEMPKYVNVGGVNGVVVITTFYSC